MQRFGEKLRALREKHGITLQQLAEELGFASHSFVYKLETGQKKPNVDHIIKLSKLFQVSADVLIHDELDVEE